MKNKYGIPDAELDKIKLRDKTCVYCHKRMIKPSNDSCRKDWATIEHLNYLPPWNNSSTVVICCGSCNSSRGNKKLLDWFKMSYCKERNINEKTVAKSVKEYIRYIENFIDRCAWTFAKTMPQVPHYYIVRDNLSNDDKKTFDDFGKYIKKNGYSDLFNSEKYDYLNIGCFKYWMIGNILNKAKNI